MTGHLFEPQFVIVKLDKAGAGEVLRVSFEPSKSENCICPASNAYVTPVLLSLHHHIPGTQSDRSLQLHMPLHIYGKVP